MSAVLIIGSSGSGKSTSIRTLDAKTTFIISVLDKPLPFKGFKKLYKPISGWNDTEGNYFVSDDWSRIVKCIQMVDKCRPDITTIILDDWQYILSHEFMKRSSERGYEKYSDIGFHGWSTMVAMNNTRPTLTGFVLAHNDTDSVGVSTLKTIGKLLSEKMSIEGIFSTCLHTRVVDGRFCFQTQHDGDRMARSPMGMFDDALIDNDLQYVKDKIESYFNEE